MRLRTAATVLLALPILSGCWGSTMSNVLGGGSAQTKTQNYYSYVQAAAASPGGASGVVVGQVALNEIGSVFNVRRVSDGQLVPVAVEYHRLVPRKLGPLTLSFMGKKRTVERRDGNLVFAGALPVSTEKRKLLAPELANGYALAGSIMFGGGEMFARAQAMWGQFPAGWFVLTLPAGEYELVNLEGQYNTSASSTSAVSGTTVTTRTRDYSVARGPRFTVQAGKTNHIGSHLYTGESVRRSTDERMAQTFATRELARMNQTLSQWPLVTANVQ